MTPLIANAIIVSQASQMIIFIPLHRDSFLLPRQDKTIPEPGADPFVCFSGWVEAVDRRECDRREIGKGQESTGLPVYIIVLVFA
jgi:hypothetical protein